MASRSNIPTQNRFSIVLLMFTTFFILLPTNVNSQKTVSFNFTKFTPGDSNIILQGDAQILTNGILAMTNRPNNVPRKGRALYSTPVPIWDKTTGVVASFVTSISFVVEDIPGVVPADGIIFFIAPPDTVIPGSSDGGLLGVVNANKGVNRFVGVEFDNYANEWDPNYAHIGIDVNSLISLKTVRWNRVSGSLVNVNIVYDSLTNTLSVSIPNEKNDEISAVAQVIDLKAVLPETVRVGLSAAITKEGAQLHHIHSWSFTSILDPTTKVPLQAT